MIPSFPSWKWTPNWLSIYISKQLKIPSLLPLSPLFNTPKKTREICQSFIRNRLPEVYNRGGCTLKHCGEKISDPSMEELNTKDDETNMMMRIPTSCHYTKHRSEWSKIQVVVAINDHTSKSLWYAVCVCIFWPLQSKWYEFVLVVSINDFFHILGFPFLVPKCEFRFLPTVITFTSCHRILACWSFTSWVLPRAWRPKSFARPVRTTLAKHPKVMAAARKALRVLYSFKGFLGRRLLNIEPAYNWYNFRIHDNFRYIHVIMVLWWYCK